MDNPNDSPFNRAKIIMLQIERIQLGRKQLVVAGVGDSLLNHVDAVIANKADDVKGILALAVKDANDEIAGAVRLYTTNAAITIHDLYKSVGEFAPQISGFRGYLDALNSLLSDSPIWRENLPL